MSDKQWIVISLLALLVFMEVIINPNVKAFFRNPFINSGSTSTSSNSSSSKIVPSSPVTGKGRLRVS